MTSLGEVQPCSLPVSRTPISLGWSTSHASPAMTSPASAPPTPIASMHELQHGHLGGRILHGHPVWPQRQHRFAPLPDLRLPAVHVGDQDLFGQGEATPELLTGPGHSVRHLRIQFFDKFNSHNLSP